MSSVSRLTFFIGKGGVGKTTISAGYAAALAARRSAGAVLLVSTDPAHSLGDVFEIPKQECLAAPHRMRGARGELFAWQIPAQQQFDKFINRYRKPILEVLENSTIFSRKELEPLLSTTMPGMAEFASLLALADALEMERYGAIVVDTAPLGHTLRLFEMPEHFRRFLDFLDLAGSRDEVLAAHFGGTKKISHVFLHEWEEKLERVRMATSSEKGGAEVVLVSSFENFSLNEAVRAKAALEAGGTGLEIGKVVLNRARVAGKSQCVRCSQAQHRTRAAKHFLKQHFRRVEIHEAEDLGGPILGAQSLAGFGAHIFFGKSRPKMPPPPLAQAPRMKLSSWPLLKSQLTMTLGKGGVGKTTISAALAFHQRKKQSKNPVTICSTDPAPSLDDVFLQEVGPELTPVLRDPKLQSAELDAVGEYREWAARVRERVEAAFRGRSRGVHLDLSFERRLFSAILEMVPPGVDEIFAIFRILDLLEREGSKEGFTVIDMAPTGHAIELLRMPQRMEVWTRLLLRALAEHRSLRLAQDAAVEIAKVEQKVRELSKRLTDVRRTQLCVVMLAETLPDRETVRLLQKLRAMGAAAKRVFINRVRMSETECTYCCMAQQWQVATLARLPERLPGIAEVYVVAEAADEPAGRKGLQSLTRTIWRLETKSTAKVAKRVRRKK